MPEGNIIDTPVADEEVATAKDSILQIPPIDVEHREELFKSAYEHILDTRVGKIESAFKWRFENQIFAEMRLLHGDELGALFDESDKNFSRVRRKVRILRYTSLLTVLTFLTCFVLLQRGLAGGVAEANRLHLAGFAGGCLFLAGVNFANRKIALQEIRQLASSFGGLFNRNMMTLRTKVHRAFEQIRNDGATSEGCGERAAKWNHIAFWLDDLMLAYDRYVTTHVWRTRTHMRWVRRLFIGVSSLAVLAGFLIAILGFGATAGVSLATYGAASLLLAVGWDFWFNAKGAADVWVETFDDAVTGQSEEERRDHHSITRSSHVLHQIRDREYQNAVVN